ALSYIASDFDLQNCWHRAIGLRRAGLGVTINDYRISDCRKLAANRKDSKRRRFKRDVEGNSIYAFIRVGRLYRCTQSTRIRLTSPTIVKEVVLFGSDDVGLRFLFL